MKMDSKDVNDDMNSTNGEMKMESDSTKIHDVSLHTLLQPASGFAISNIPAITLIKSDEAIEVNALGFTAYNNHRSWSNKYYFKIYQCCYSQ